MLNLDVFKMIAATPSVKSDIKKKKLVVVKRKSPKEIGDIVARAVMAAIKEHGPICAGDIAKITNHSSAGVRSCINRLNKNTVFTTEKRCGGSSRRNVTYYSMA